MFRKGLGGQSLGFVLINATTGAGLPGVAVIVKRVIDNGAQVDATGAVTDKGLGQYNFAPSADDLNGNCISFLFLATGAVPAERTVLCTAADPSNAASYGLTNLDALISSRSTYSGGPVASVSGSVGSVAGSVGSVVAPVTVSIVNDKSGYSLNGAGVDGIEVESGVNLRQALSPILAAAAGVLSGAGTGSIEIQAGGNPTVTRITASADNNGNRSGVTLSLPT